MNEEMKVQATVMQRLMEALVRKARTGAVRRHRPRGQATAPGRHSGDDPRGGSVRSILSHGMYSRVRSSTRTGMPPHVRNWRTLSLMRRQAQKIPVTALPGVPAGILSALETHAGFKNVWDLAQAPIDRVLDTPGVGPKMANKVRVALLSRSVPVAWKAV